MAVLDWLQQLLGSDPGGSGQPSAPAMQQNPQTGAFEPYTPPQAPSALDMLANLTGATDMQQAYGAARRGEYLPALGQGAYGAGQAAAMAVPALRSGMAAVQAGVPVAREMAGALPALMRDEFGGIRVYHGSPYDFDAFDASKIGTGEGAQAYGHGLYFAESEPVAQNYRNTLAKPAKNDPVGNAWDLLYNYNQSRPELLEHFDELLNASSDPVKRKFYQDTITAVESGAVDKYKPPGRMYEVDLNAEPHQFLDWDKPLGEQPQPVREALANVQHPVIQDWLAGAYPNATGQNAYNALGYRGERPIQTPAGTYDVPYHDPAPASQTLNQAGIPGIRYLDQGSRGRFFPAAQYQMDLAKANAEVADLSGALKTTQEFLQSVEPGSRAHNSLSFDVLNHSSQLESAQRRLDQLSKNPVEGPQGTSNYVMFDPALITILRKYGLMGPAAGAGLLGAADQ